jgi:hypothetical protein
MAIDLHERGPWISCGAGLHFAKAGIACIQAALRRSGAQSPELADLSARVIGRSFADRLGALRMMRSLAWTQIRRSRRALRCGISGGNAAIGCASAGRVHTGCHHCAAADAAAV